MPIDAGLRIETRYFINTQQRPEAKAMIRSLFLSMQELSKGANRPAGHPKTEFKKIAVIGAGLMGAGIAYVQAKAGIPTVLVDVSKENAEKGKDYSRRLVDKDVSRGKSTKEKGDALLDLITTTDNYDDVKGADLVIEAVFENEELKAKITQMAEAVLDETAVFGSNTSTLPITGLAKRRSVRKTSSAFTSSRRWNVWASWRSSPARKPAKQRSPRRSIMCSPSARRRLL